MILRLVFSILIFLSAIVESTILPFPFVFILSFVLFVFFEDLFSLFIIFICALFLDLLFLNNIGYTPLIIFSFFILIAFLENVFSSRNAIFLGASLILGVVLYQWLSNYPLSIMLTVFLAIGVGIYTFLEKRRLNAEK